MVVMFSGRAVGEGGGKGTTLAAGRTRPLNKNARSYSKTHDSPSQRPRHPSLPDPTIDAKRPPSPNMVKKDRAV